MKEPVIIPSAEGPETFTGLRRSHPKHYAAGIPAVISSMRHILREMPPGRGWRALLQVNQAEGFDCPGCAWPDPDDHRSPIGEYCENGAKAIAEEATTRVLDEDFFARHSVSELSLLSDYEIGKKGRVGVPVYLREGSDHYEPVTWDQAFGIIADRLNELAIPDEAVFYTSGRTSNEAAFLYQLFVREFGTNNMPDCSNMCHESSGVALTEAVGIGKGSVTLEDFYEAEVVLILGQNPGTNHPRMLSALERAKANGAVIISVNPLREAGLLAFRNPQEVSGWLGRPRDLTDHYLQVRINADMALLQFICLMLWDEERRAPGTVFDLDFIRDHTSGAEAYLQHLSEQDRAALLQMTGLAEDEVRKVAEALMHKRKIIACWAMGLTQHKNSVATIREVVNLLLLKGSIGKPGAGTCPVRGHSNVQGDRTMGIYEKPSPAFLASLEALYGFRPPQNHGWDTVEAIHAMHRGEGKVFFALGGNFLSATPDTAYTAEALRRCRLTVHVSTKLNRSHLVHGREALILPCLGRSDRDEIGGQRQFVSCENSMGVVQKSSGSLSPVSSHLLSEPVLICRLARAVLGPGSQTPWERYATHYDAIRDDIEAVIPGFEQYNMRVRRAGGFYLPNGARDGRFLTPERKAVFHVAVAEEEPLEEGMLLMMTIRSHDQFNTTIYGLDDRYRGIYSERRVVLIHRDDLAARGLQDGDILDLYNCTHGRERVAQRFIAIAYDIPRGCIATYFPETNVLVPAGRTAEKSNTPVSKSVGVWIRKHVGADTAG